MSLLKESVCTIQKKLCSGENTASRNGDNHRRYNSFHRRTISCDISLLLNLDRRNSSSHFINQGFLSCDNETSKPCTLFCSSNRVSPDCCQHGCEDSASDNSSLSYVTAYDLSDLSDCRGELCLISLPSSSFVTAPIADNNSPVSVNTSVSSQSPSLISTCSSDKVIESDYFDTVELDLVSPRRLATNDDFHLLSSPSLTAISQLYSLKTFSESNQCCDTFSHPIKETAYIDENTTLSCQKGQKICHVQSHLTVIEEETEVVTQTTVEEIQRLEELLEVLKDEVVDLGRFVNNGVGVFHLHYRSHLYTRSDPPRYETDNDMKSGISYDIPTLLKSSHSEWTRHKVQCNDTQLLDCRIRADNNISHTTTADNKRLLCNVLSDDRHQRVVSSHSCFSTVSAEVVECSQNSDDLQQTVTDLLRQLWYLKRQVSMSLMDEDNRNADIAMKLVRMDRVLQSLDNQLNDIWPINDIPACLPPESVSLSLSPVCVAPTIIQPPCPDLIVPSLDSTNNLSSQCSEYQQENSLDNLESQGLRDMIESEVSFEVESSCSYHSTTPRDVILASDPSSYSYDMNSLCDGCMSSCSVF